MSAHRHRPLDLGKAALVIAFAITPGYALIELAGGVWSGSLALSAFHGALMRARCTPRCRY